jgi:hypothetical protein
MTYDVVGSIELKGMTVAQLMAFISSVEAGIPGSATLVKLNLVVNGDAAPVPVVVTG